eukprot:XP_001608750.1 hypothetical protein [Babesia bovis T2Bo]
MGTIKGDHFHFEPISIERVGSDPPEYRVFRVPVPLETSYTAPGDGGDTSQVAPSEANGTPIYNSVQQNAVTVRSPFRRFIERNIEKVEKKKGVRMSLNPQGASLVLIAHGDRSTEAINEMLNMCRKSNVYNFYLCFPVRGAEFHGLFDEFKSQVKQCIGQNVAYEMRPHVTLALLNLVTDEDLDAIIKALQATAVAVSQLRAPDSTNQGYEVHLEGTKSIKYKGKAARRSVFMTNAQLNEALSDIAYEFQDSVKRAINKVINKSNEASQHQRAKPTKNVSEIGRMTEAEAAAHGIFITPGGNIEVTYTDIELMDPKGVISDEQLDSMIAELHGRNTVIDEPSPIGPAAKTGNKIPTKLEPTNEHDQGTQLDDQSDNDYATVYREPETINTDEEVDVPEYDPSVTHEFHVTLLRNSNVDKLGHLDFKGNGLVNCVELRARGAEVCSFKAYTKTQLMRFVGHRYDGRLQTEYGVNYPSGTEQPSGMSHDLVTDNGANKEHNAASRFVFWI